MKERKDLNYPNDYDFTRVTEFKYITGQINPKTTIAYEYMLSDGNPYYPIPIQSTLGVRKIYIEGANFIEDVYFVDRRVEYRYLQYGSSSG